jgi:DNA-binding NtrC family response regulator
MKSYAGKTVAVIDDDVDVQELVEAFFRQKDFKVLVYGSAESAMEALEADPSVWDVALVDLHLPKMSGLDFTLAAKKITQNLPIILITTSKSAEMAVDAIEKGAYDFIVKPIHFPQLYISVQRGLHFKNLQGDISELRTHVKNLKNPHGSIIGKSPRFLDALNISKRVAPSTTNIFISGESGTGKEVFAKYIHNESTRKKGPFIAINCSAIPENLLESELFGHAKGAFTGAQDKKIGLFEEAEDGTLFLDEIGDLSLPLQAKILRVLQEKKIKRVGENQQRAVNCRIISATHKDLISEIKHRRFREDLYFRLKVIPIHLPPLRERREDILPLAESFMRKFSLENGSSVKKFSAEAIEFLLSNSWRGNVRELENAVERAVVISMGEEILQKDFMLDQFESVDFSEDSLLDLSSLENKGFYVPYSEEKIVPLEEVMNRYIEYTVKKNHGARDKTAREIGIDRKTLYKRLSKASEERGDGAITS